MKAPFVVLLSLCVTVTVDSPHSTLHSSDSTRTPLKIQKLGEIAVYMVTIPILVGERNVRSGKVLIRDLGFPGFRISGFRDSMFFVFVFEP
jgi:hypothetical protein